MRLRVGIAALLLVAMLGPVPALPAADDPALPALDDDDCDQTGVAAPVVAAPPIDLPELSPPDPGARLEEERRAPRANSACTETTSPRAPPFC